MKTKILKKTDKVVVIEWSGKTGFGQLAVRYTDDGNYKIDAEYIGIDTLFEIIRNTNLNPPKSNTYLGIIYLNWLVATTMKQEPIIVRYGKSRKRELVVVRQMSQYIARHYGHTYQSIADFFRYKRHESIMSNVKAVTNDMETDKQLKTDIETIINKITFKK